MTGPATSPDVPNSLNPPFSVSGDANLLEQDPGKVYHGDVIDVTARVVFEKIGRRMPAGMDAVQVGATIKDEVEPE